MAKKPQKRLDRNAKPGCMWGLINMLDFRHGRTTQKLLPDRRRETKRVIGSGNKTVKPDVALNSDQKTLDGEGNTALISEFYKPSVKKLIEEDLLKEHNLKSEISDSEVKPKFEVDCQRKNSKRTNRSRSKSCEIHVESLDAADIRVAEQPYPLNLEKQSSISLDVGEIIEEFCNQLQEKGSGCEFHQPKQNNIDFGERLSKAIKVFVSQKVNERRKHLSDGGDVCSSTELKDALQILFSREELASKLSQGQKSIIMKQFEKAWNSQVEKDDDSSLFVSSMEDQEVCEWKKSHEPVGTKHRRFFRRAKSLVNNSSSEADTLKASNRIVILKPGPAGMQKPETKSSFDCPRQCQLTTKDKGSNERGSSHFSLTEIKRRLKNAMAKEMPHVSNGHTSKRYSNEVWVSGDGDRRIRVNTGKSSPVKEHFSIEKVARPLLSARKAQMMVKHKGSGQSIDDQASNPTNPRLSDIYLEAKKHLSEMLITGTEDLDLPSNHVHKPLGRILSFPEYSFSPVSSPSRELRPSFVTAQMRSPGMDSVHRWESSISKRGRISPSSNVLSFVVSEDGIDTKAQQVLSDPVSCSSSESALEGDGETVVGSTRNEMMTQGEVVIEKATEITALEESDILDNLSETSSSSVIINERNAAVGDEKTKNELLEQEKSMLEGPSTSLNCKHGLEATEILDRPSPVSVLEPLFAEKDVSPAASRTKQVELLVQPLRIDFEEQDSSSVDLGTSHLESADRDPILEYIKDVLLVSGLNWEEFYLMSDSSDEILDQSSCDEFEFLPNQLCCDKQLLFNCIDEVLMEVYDCYFGCSPGLSVGKPVIRPIPDMKHTIYEVWERVHWHILPLPSPGSLDQVVRKDMAKSGVWMDLRRDTETALVEISEAIFKELIEETIICLSDSSEVKSHLVPGSLEEGDSSSV